MEIGFSTLTRWKRDFPEFRELICKGKKDYLSSTKRSIYRRAMGYRYQEVTKEKCTMEKVNDDGEVEKVPAVITKTVTKHMPASVNACLSILKNSKIKEWD